MSLTFRDEIQKRLQRTGLSVPLIDNLLPAAVVHRRLKHGVHVLRGPMLIRAEEQRDWAAVHAVNVSAFGTPAEANLVDALREQAQPIVSLIAEDNGVILGHIMFSPVSLSGLPALRIMGLAPMAVAREHQRKGIGSALVRAGLEQCTQLGFAAVVVLGHPAYYPRFGFSPSARFGIGCEYEVPEEVFMVAELQADFLQGASGKVRYHAPIFCKARPARLDITRRSATNTSLHRNAG